MKPYRGRQRKIRRKVFVAAVSQNNVNLFLETVDEALRNREYKDFNDDLNSKGKLSLHKSFCRK